MKEVNRDRAQLSADRIRNASEILDELFSTAFESKAWVLLENETSMKDWFFRYYDLISGIFWMMRNSLEEEAEILESYLWEEECEEYGKTEEE